METHTIRREELFALLWSESREKVAARFAGISPAIVTRTCEEANIPLPSRGHWARLESGEQIPRPALPLRWPGHDEVLHLSPGRERASGRSLSDEQLLGADPPVRPEFDDDIDILVAAAEMLLRPIHVRRDLSSPHAEVKKLLAAEERRRQKALKWNSSWDGPRYEGPFFQRQLRIFNALFLGMAPLARRVSLSDEARFERGVGTGYVLTASFQIGTARLGLTFPMKEVVTPEKAVTYKPSPPVRLELQADHVDKRSIGWEDSSENPLEKQLDAVAQTLLVQAEVRRRAHAVWLHEWYLERIRDAHARRAERVAKEEAAQVDALLAMADNLERAERVRRLAAAFAALGVPPDGRDLNQWLAFANRVADQLDPRVSRASEVGRT